MNATNPRNVPREAVGKKRRGCKAALQRRALLSLLALPLLFSWACADDNVGFVGRYDPNFFAELQDVEVVDDRAYVFGVGGLAIIDIGDPTNPTLRGRYEPIGHPFNRLYRGVINGNYAYCGGREDLLSVVLVGNEIDPPLLEVLGTPGMSYEGMGIHGNRLYACRHADGIEVYWLAIPDDPFVVAELPDLVNSWDIAFSGNHGYVADGGGGLAVLDVSEPNAPVHLYSLPTAGAAVDVDISGQLAAVACGSAGIDIFDIGDPTDVQWRGNYNSSGLAITLAAVGDRVYLADWDDVEVVDISYPSSPSLIGYENTPVRAMGLAAVGDLIYVADWSRFRIYEFGSTLTGDVELPYSEVDFGDVPVGAVVDTTFIVHNTGGGSLIVDDIESFNPHFEILPPQSFVLASEESREVGLRFHHLEEGYDATFIKVLSQDPDEAEKLFPTSGENDPNFLDIGDVAPDFHLEDRDGVTHYLSDYLGQVVVLAFFANW